MGLELKEKGLRVRIQDFQDLGVRVSDSGLYGCHNLYRVKVRSFEDLKVIHWPAVLSVPASAFKVAARYVFPLAPHNPRTAHQALQRARSHFAIATPNLGP